MVDVPIWSVLVGLFGLLETATAAYTNNPKIEHLDDLEDVRGERLDDVSSAIAPIVSEAYQFMRDTDGESPEYLDQNDQAAIAVTEAVEGGETLLDAWHMLNSYFFPDQAFRRCKRGYRVFSYGSIVAIVLSLFSLGSLYAFGQQPRVEILSTTLSVIALLSALGSMSGFVYYAYYNSKIEEMIESVELVLD